MVKLVNGQVPSGVYKALAPYPAGMEGAEAVRQELVPHRPELIVSGLEGTHWAVVGEAQ